MISNAHKSDHPLTDTATTPPQRILMATARYFPLMGGTETHVYEVARRMAAAGHSVTVLTTDLTGKLPARETAAGVEVIRVKAWPADRDFYFAPQVYQVIGQRRWDVIHCQGYHTLVAPLAMFAALRAHTPYVLTFHSGGHSSAARNSMRGTQRRILRPLLVRANRLIGVSHFEADFFSENLHIPRSRFVVVPNGSNLPKIDVIPVRHEDAPLIVSVGRLEAYKRHQDAITAFPHVLKAFPGARLRIAGGGPYESTLRDLVSTLGLTEKVEIAGIPATDREGMARLMSEAALVTLLSEYEAHPVSVMEALSLRRPVLVADTSGLRELAERGLVRSIPMDSSPEIVGAAIVHNLRDPLLPPAIALPTWDDCAANLLAVYAEVVGQRASV